MAPRILVVEDTPGVARLLEVTLGAAGFEVGAVETWTEAAERSDDRAPIDLVVFEFFLPNGPDGDALASCRAVKARRPGTPLVVLAPDGRAATRAACLEAGADAFLRRPLDPVELKAVVSAASCRRMAARRSRRRESGSRVASRAGAVSVTTRRRASTMSSGGQPASARDAGRRTSGRSASSSSGRRSAATASTRRPA